MLKFLTRIFYHNRIYTNEPELCYEIYKWKCGLFTLLSLRRVIGFAIFGIIGTAVMIFTKSRICGMGFIAVGLLLNYIELIEAKKTIEFNTVGMRTPSQIRTLKIYEFIMKFVSKSGKALGKKEWKAIKKYDIGLYNDLLSDECEGCCYWYSLEIIKIIKDSCLIWGAIKEPFDDERYYAHAVIIRNGYIYDSNMHTSERYEDFVKLYEFKLYKQWNHNKCTTKDFRESERAEFRKWCKENNVSEYERF